MKKNWHKIIFGFTLVLAFVLRLVALDRFPAGFTADEAAQGYTAYSILKTGKDEWGVRLPLTPRSFGDYKPPLQTYLMIPSIAVLGLNELAVRLPNAILGTLAILAVFLLAKELFKDTTFGEPLSLMSAFLLAVSPWHMSFSRGAAEANLITFFMPIGCWFFLKGLKKPNCLPLAGVFLGLNLFTCHAAKLLTPLLVIILVVWGRKELFRLKKEKGKVITGGIIFSCLMILTFYSILTGGGTRVADIGIFSAGLEAPKLFFDSYFSYLSLRFLFTQGAGEATYGMIPGRGVVYFFELPFLILALYTLIKKKDRNFTLILIWLVLAPVPAALSRGVGYHASRAAGMMPAIQILSAYGGILLWQKRKKIHKVAILLYYCITAISFLLFIKNYFLDAPKINAPAMAYGWKEVIDYLTTQERNYKKIIVSRRFSESQALVAFYKKWNPADFQKQSQNWLKYEKEGLKFIDQLGQYSLGKYEFRNLNFSDDKNLNKVLLVGRPEEFPSDTAVQKMIIYPDGQRAFYIVDPEKQ